jgi:hypothetical protein
MLQVALEIALLVLGALRCVERAQLRVNARGEVAHGERA